MIHRQSIARMWAAAAVTIAPCAALPALAQTPAAAPAAAPASAAAADAALYQDLGGSAGITALMKDLVVRLKADARVAPFFERTNMGELARQLGDQVCALAGGPCEYRGAPMKLVHADFEIRRADFNALVEVLQQSMDARGIAFGTQNRLLALLAPMHRDIVNTR